MLENLIIGFAIGVFTGMLLAYTNKYDKDRE